MTEVPTDRRPLPPALALLAIAAGLVLIGLGITSVVAPSAAAKLFGILVADAAGRSYVTVAGIRDLAAGVLVVAFALLRDRRAVGASVAVGTLIPVGDGWVALMHSPTPWQCVPIHWGGAIACVVFAAVLLRPAARTQS